MCVDQDKVVLGIDPVIAGGGGPPGCGCSHQQFASYGDNDECASRSVPSAFGFLGGAVLSVTIPPRGVALMGPLAFKPTVRCILH